MHHRILQRPFALAIVCLLCFLSAPGAEAQIIPTGFRLDDVVTGGFEPAGPIGFTFLTGGRSVIVEASGKVHAATAGGDRALIHTIPDVRTGVARGLQGVAADSRWPDRPYMYFLYNHVDSVMYLTMYRVIGDLEDPLSTNLQLVDPYDILTDLPDQNEQHNGGTVRFGPDGLLYVSQGDDLITPCSSQDPTSLLGSILRLDVSALPGAGSGPPPKSVITPASNPLPGPDENTRLTYALGLRNPYRFTIDHETGDIFIGDVGQDSFEEVDVISFSKGGGDNFGWPQREGYVPFCCAPPCFAEGGFTQPIYAYPHGSVQSVVCGPRYRHNVSLFALPPSYDGSLFVADFFDGWIRRLVLTGEDEWALADPVSGQPSPENWAENLGRIADFQQGPDGALYFLNYTFAGGEFGGLYRIRGQLVTSVVPDERPGTLVPFAVPNPVRGGIGTFIHHPAHPGGRLQILDVSGRVIRQFSTDIGPRLRWDVRTEQGAPVGSGIYFLQLETAEGRIGVGKISVLR